MIPSMKNLFPFLFVLASCTTPEKLTRYPLSPSEVLKKATSKDWRTPNEKNLIYFYVNKEPVVIELSPAFAPKHFENIKKIVKSKYWDGLYVMRSQDNYVIQWGDPDEKKKGFLKKHKSNIAQTLPGEFEVALSSLEKVSPLKDKDVYSSQVGFVNGFPVGYSSKENKAWLAHCYGMVGVSRDEDPNSGNGSSLYVVTGHSPRHLDRNITLVGRVLHGIENLSTIQRGKGALGFFKDKKKYVPIRKVRMASQVSKKQKLNLKVLRTDTSLFQEYIEARKSRKESWFHRPAGHISLCNVNIPVQNSKH